MREIICSACMDDMPNPDKETTKFFMYKTNDGKLDTLINEWYDDNSTLITVGLFFDCSGIIKYSMTQLFTGQRIIKYFWTTAYDGINKYSMTE